LPIERLWGNNGLDAREANMKYPVLIILMMVLIPVFALFVLVRVAQAALEIFLFREHGICREHQPD
jgi:hypothetical protein